MGLKALELKPLFLGIVFAGLKPRRFHLLIAEC